MLSEEITDRLYYTAVLTIGIGALGFGYYTQPRARETHPSEIVAVAMKIIGATRQRSEDFLHPEGKAKIVQDARGHLTAESRRIYPGGEVIEGLIDHEPDGSCQTLQKRTRPNGDVYPEEVTAIDEKPNGTLRLSTREITKIYSGTTRVMVIKKGNNGTCLIDDVAVGPANVCDSIAMQAAETCRAVAGKMLPNAPEPDPGISPWRLKELHEKQKARLAKFRSNNFTPLK
jgi:hypothetical protein